MEKYIVQFDEELEIINMHKLFESDIDKEN